jgi:hypothetical protein
MAWLIELFLTDGSPTCAFLYVDATAEGILLATERLNQSMAVNPSLPS